MTTHADLRPGTAVHACAQCKASKKKCDKTLPSCDRCSRLVLQCNYDEGAGITPAEIISRFEAVFDRLGRLEENVFPPTAVTNASPASPASPAARSSTARPTDLEAEKLQISPRLLQPSYLDIIAGANVHKILEEKSMTMRGVVHRYCDIHNYMPIISKAKINKQIQEAEALNTNSAFMVLIIAILLLTEHPTTHDGAPGLSELYRVCKYHFSLFSSLKDPSVELLQVGLCIALYEYAHCITERAYITIGICARMASLLGLRYDNDSSPQYALTEDYFDESAHIITAMRLLNRHIYLSLTMLGKHLSVEYSTIIDAPDPPETPVSGWVADSFRYETEGCRILCRLQQTFHEESAVRGPGISGSTQLDRVLALDNELQSMKLNLQDYNDPPTWRGEFAAYTVVQFPQPTGRSSCHRVLRSAPYRNPDLN
ncbi:hypothetical protein BJX99DRAFT_239808 [Aspergillus californicus]